MARAAYLAYRAASGVARMLPAPMLGPIERLASVAAPKLMKGRARQVDRNLRRAYGPELGGPALRQARVDTFASYVHYWVESFRLPGTPSTAIAAGMTIEGFGHIEAGLAAGSGVILALPHLGGWEWAAFWLTAVKGLPVTAVVEAVEPPELAEWFRQLRSDLGMEIVMLGADAGRASVRALRENRILCLVSDRDLRGDGVEVEFFGERTTLPAGPATLALRTGAALLPAAVYFDGQGRHHAVVHGPLDATRQGRLRDDVQRMTEELAREFEGFVRAAPEQWHLLQPNWPSDRLSDSAG